MTSVAPRKTIGRSPRALWRWAKRLAKALGLRGGTLLLAYGMAVWGVLTDRPRRATLRALRRAFQRPRDQTASVDGSSRRCGTARPFQSARRDRACDSRRTRPRRSPARASSDRAPARRPGRVPNHGRHRSPGIARQARANRRASCRRHGGRGPEAGPHARRRAPPSRSRTTRCCRQRC